jgi:hypothetical protein
MAIQGRPVKYTPERLSAILDSISNRIPYELAAEANGITDRTLYAWIEQGRDEMDRDLDTPLSKFSQAIKQMEEKRIKHHLDKLNDNVERWQSDAWILERRWYKYFGANVHLNEIERRLKDVEEKAKEDMSHEQEAEENRTEAKEAQI